jgi:predicted anti-sigma-YlaC factor YlaD
MALDREQVRKLIATVADTREDEIDCDTCLASMAEFAELELVGAEIPEALHRIRAHLEYCSECAEEYRVLLDAVGAVS